ncbi:50S ribosomal protein L2 [Candidatus Woesearchaeota archaeon CG10_big_fil_rev_8_21_14_0_10_37_12]|nr:MAG: 50S ribosomal protein L2 [Candidatus Woesearchaeota archaeon CG10_big_fil_rev_8_21_14_0_10_37_12]
MGKRIAQQARGKGGPAWRARSFAYAGQSRLRSETQQLITGQITNFIKSAGHSAPLMEVKYQDGQTALLPAPEHVRQGNQITSGKGGEALPGNALYLSDIPEGTPIYNIEKQPGDGGKFCKTGGSTARLLSKTETHATIKLPSKKEKQINLKCRAIIGVIAGGGRLEKPLLKAGVRHHKKRSMNKNWPKPRAAAQNAVDHPYGNKRTSRKAKQKSTNKFAPPGRKVGKLWPRRTGRKK